MELARRVGVVASTVATVVAFVVGTIGPAAAGPARRGTNLTYITVPSRPAATTLRHGPCTVRSHAPQPNVHRPLPVLRANPTGATIMWFPGLNQRPCVARLTTVPARVARTIQRRLNRLPAFPRGVIACPAADGTAARIFFRYPHRQRTLAEYVELSGCRSVDARAHYARQLRPATLMPLRPYAPPSWRSALAG